MVTYDSGADGHYISERDRATARLPILRQSTRLVGVADGNTCRGKHVTKLPIPGLSPKAMKKDTFDTFPDSLLSVGKVVDDGAISIFTSTGVSVHNEHDVLVTCKGKPILIGARDSSG